MSAALTLQREFLNEFPVSPVNCSFDAGDPQPNRTDMCAYEIDWEPAGPFPVAQVGGYRDTYNGTWFRKHEHVTSGCY